MNPENPKNTEQGAGQPLSVMEEAGVEKLITRWNIQPEDFPLIERLADFPKDLIIELLHNHFNNTYRERSAEMLERLSEIVKDENAKEIYGIFLKLAERYDWKACYALVAELESRQQEPDAHYKWLERRRRERLQKPPELFQE